LVDVWWFGDQSGVMQREIADQQTLVDGIGKMNVVVSPSLLCNEKGLGLINHAKSHHGVCLTNHS
jgi:hypothetical protein